MAKTLPTALLMNPRTDLVFDGKRSGGKKESRKDNLKFSGLDYFVKKILLKPIEIITLKRINGVNGVKKNFGVGEYGQQLEKGRGFSSSTQKRRSSTDRGRGK
jgi:hypothetical protein